MEQRETLLSEELIDMGWDPSLRMISCEVRCRMHRWQCAAERVVQGCNGGGEG